MFSLSTVSNVVGVLLIVVGTLMLTALPFSFYYESGDAAAILKAAAVTILVGGLSWWYKFKTREKVEKREGYLIVVLGWIGMVLFGTLPYWFSGVLPSFTNAFFESASGLTTTGASVINDIEATPEGILYWRSLSQWIGGMGIIVLTVAIFPLLGVGGIELFVAEAPGPTSDKIHPRIKETAKRLWLIYVGLTATLCALLYSLGMSFFDAINHALTTMATGGFSTKNASMIDQSPSIQYVITLFMFLGGVNYTIIYFGLMGKMRKVWSSDEFKTYVIFILVLIAIVTTGIYFNSDFGLERSFRNACFQTISVVTTTGYVCADYTSWNPALTLLFFMLLFMGASAGSTSGGIKIIRHLVFFKNSFLEFKRLLHPKALIRIKIDNKIVAPRILTHILVFLLIYLISFVIGSIIMALILTGTEQPLLTAIGSVATALGNVGPGIGAVGPLNNFAEIPDAGKWFLSFLMLLGRLELFTILILFTPYFWRTI